MRRIVFIPMLFSLLLVPAAGLAGEREEAALKERVEELEKRTRELERDVRVEHRGLFEKMKRRLETLEAGLNMVDYRTGRIRAMEEKIGAFTIGGDLSLFLQGALSNNQGRGDRAEGSYSGDLFLIVPAGPYGNVYFRGDAGQGEGVAALLPHTFSGPNADLEFDEPGFELVEAWYWTEIPLPDQRDRRIEVVIGKLDPTAIFDGNAAANSETDQFMADIFVNNLAVDFGGDANGYGPGMTLSYRFTSIYNKGLKTTARLGLFEGDGDFKGVLDRPFIIAELDVWRPYYGLIGNYRFYAWLNKTGRSALLDPARDGLSNYGVGVSIDRQISGDVTLFARYGLQRKEVSEFDQTFTVGGRIKGNLWGRGNDAVGAAWGLSHVSADYKEANPSVDASFEHYMEAYYKFWANKNLSISPDVQYIINPGGDGAEDGVFIYGTRMQLTF